jgi:flagellar assembly factor FliW
LDFDPKDRLLFPAGIVGLEDCQEWVVLADADNDALGWLQSASRREIALPVVSPRRYVSNYQLRVARSELAPLELAALRDAQVLVIVGKNESGITLNLKAPLVINLALKLGRQVVANNDYPIQFELNSPRRLLKTA